jgi:hypothetical protein
MDTKKEDNNENASNGHSITNIGKAENGLGARDGDGESQSDLEISDEDLRLLKNARVRLEEPREISMDPFTLFEHLQDVVGIPRKERLSSVRLWFKSLFTDSDYFLEPQSVSTMDSTCLCSFHSKRLEQQLYSRASNMYSQYHKLWKYCFSKILKGCSPIPHITRPKTHK